MKKNNNSTTHSAPGRTPARPSAGPAVPARNLSGNPSPEDLIRAYVGTNYDEISTNRFSWPGFFFGSLYLFYRKTDGYAWLLFFIEFALLSSVHFLIVWFASRMMRFGFYLLIFLGLLLRTAYGFLTNRIYLHAVKRKVAKIKAANPTASHEELKTICASKGGRSIPAAVIAAVAVVTISTAIGLIIALAVGYSMSSLPR